MTQLELAKKGVISPQMKTVAQAEGLEVEFIRQSITEGTIVIPADINHAGLVPCDIGQGLSTKMNANIGTSSGYGDLNTELEKLRVAVEARADAVMDLSTGGDIPAIRRTRRVHTQHISTGSAYSMCGNFCTIELVEKYLGVHATKC
ncbi:MAG: phosphomethylpyrimidine synthase ThiC [Candidatus Neomarinimicrobiota bacterium]